MAMLICTSRGKMQPIFINGPGVSNEVLTGLVRLDRVKESWGSRIRE